MLQKNLTRRSVIKSTALAAGSMAAGSALADVRVEAKGLTTEQAARLHQQEYIIGKLQRVTRSAKSVTQAELENFAAAFTEVHGLVDYQKMFSSLGGEIRLARLFMQGVLQVRA